MVQTRPDRGSVALIAVVGLIVALWIAGTVYWLGRLGEIALGDFTTYWVGAGHVLHGEPLYSSWQLESDYRLGFASNGRGYVYPPTSAVLTAPLGLLPLSVAWAVVTVFSFLALAAVTCAIAFGEGLSSRSSLAIALAVAISPPALEAMTTGNANTQVAIALAAIWVSPKLSGYLAIVGGLVKLYPVALIAWAIRKRAPMAIPVALGLAFVCASVLWLGIGTWHDFAIATFNARSGSDFVLPSIRAGLGPLLGAGAADAIAYTLTALVLAAAVISRSDRLAFLLLSVAMILPAPDWYLHYLIVPLVGAVPVLSASLAAVRRGPRLGTILRPALRERPQGDPRSIETPSA